ncbi:LacI family DNA-binding transcriptional regulator [Jiella endophytica]|uniref:LacI family DNA-binding transcriptional regulator n=1 Tax=Jiella endophytica TaxID=2558362 RepID=A0A4Y8RUU9_9HYPH|nr:LacI family DNA-binding transcriptional regulator [Jiella endophytica]TFF27214.1 LacI family DNA-binding transcriptional regulator [Jiella endophytica]
MTDEPKRPPTGPNFVSAQQVADHAGVSRSAVSRSFTPGASIGPETRKKVMKAAAELGYQVNDLARGLIARQSRLVGMIGTRPEVGFRAHLVAALSKALIARGSLPVLLNTGDTDVEMQATQNMLLGYRAEATIVLSGSPPRTILEGARRTGQPLVLIGRSEPGTDSLLADNATAAETAAQRLIARGARRIALLGAQIATQTIVEREQAFLAAIRRLGAEPRIVRGADADYAGGETASRELLGDGEPPDAVFCVNDLLAMGLIDNARCAGWRVPEDMAVIGFDDLPEASRAPYRLTTFFQDPAKVAARAIELLDRRQADPDAPPALVRLPVELVARTSG